MIDLDLFNYNHTGLAIDSDRSEWAEWSEIKWKNFRCHKFNDLVEQMGYPRYPDDLYPQTQLFTVYAVPEELNYAQFRENKSWFNIEVFHKYDHHSKVPPLESIVPSEFLSSDLNGKFSGKLVYFSLGSMGTIDVCLMQRLVAILAETNHKYIVSKGPLHAQYQLASNMWGAEFLPQTTIVSAVDLVITHGGNNTVTEVFAKGKPMIVMPLFCDQYNNAQRITETGYGARVDPYTCTAGELCQTIERLLSDQVLEHKLKLASERIALTNHHEELAELIEKKLTELQENKIVKN